jgi:hypothetical protein
VNTRRRRTRRRRPGDGNGTATIDYTPGNHHKAVGKRTGVDCHGDLLVSHTRVIQHSSGTKHREPFMLRRV